MLSKEVCRSCIDSRWGGSASVWREHDDAEWERGVVSCGVDILPRDFWSARVHELPPEWCPYAVEHVVSQEC